MLIFNLDEVVAKRGSCARIALPIAPGTDLPPIGVAWRWSMPGRARRPATMTIGRSRSIIFLSVADVAAWWAMGFSRTPDGQDERFEKLAWWRRSDAMSLSRKRSIMTEQPEKG